MEKKVSKHKTNNFLSLIKLLCAKFCCFCCFLFTCFCFISSFLLVLCFSRSKFFLKKKQTDRTCLDSFIYYSTDLYSPQPLYGDYLLPIFFISMHLSLIVWIFCDHLWESLLFVRISLFVRNLFEPSYLCESLLIDDHLWQSLFIYDNLWESFKTSFCFLQSLWK